MARTSHSSGRREEARLAKRWKKGELEAFEELVLKYQDPVYNLVYRMVGNRQEAEDIAQEAFVKAFTGVDGFDLKMPFGTWMLRISANAAVDHLRRRRRKSEVPLDTAFSRGADRGDGREVVSEPPGSDSDIPENVSLENEVREVVQEALFQLPENYAAVLVLHHMEGMSYSQIGGVLGVPRNTAKTWAHRARGVLCEVLEGVV